MKVVHLATTLRGGAGIALQRQHAALLAAGVDSRIVLSEFGIVADEQVCGAPRARTPLTQRIIRRLGVAADAATRLRQRIPAPGTPPKFELFSCPYSTWAPEESAWVKEADVVNIHWVAEGLDWPRFFGAITCPVVFTLHDQQPYLGGFHYALDRGRNPALAALEDEVQTIKRSALGDRRYGVAGNSAWNTQAAIESGFYSANATIRTIYYAFDATAFQPRSRAAAREALGLTPDRYLIGFACEDLGNHRKGLDLLLYALARVNPQLREKMGLVSFGRKPSPTLMAQARNVPWSHLGYLDADATKAAAYSAMDIFVAPSRAEAFGQTALEAVACGTPVVAADEGGLPEAIADGEAGVLFATDDAASLAGALGDAADRQQQLRTQTAAARPTLLARHQPERCAAAYLALYEEMTRRPS